MRGGKKKIILKKKKKNRMETGERERKSAMRDPTLFDEACQPGLHLVKHTSVYVSLATYVR